MTSYGGSLASYTPSTRFLPTSLNAITRKIEQERLNEENFKLVEKIHFVKPTIDHVALKKHEEKS